MRMSKLMKSLGIVCVVGLLACLAGADTIFEENFNGMAQSALVNGTAATVGSFTVDNRGGAVNVAADPSGGAAGARGNTLLVIDYNRLGSYAAEVKTNFSTATSSAIRASYDIYNDGPVPQIDNPEAGIFLEGSGRASYLFWYGNGPVGVYNYGPGFNQTTEATNLPIQTWLRVVFDAVEGTTEAGQTAAISIYSINADGSTGSLLASSGSMDYFQAVDTYGNLRFGQSGTAGRSNFYLDNILVETVPEPATMSLLGIGLVGMIVRSKSKRS